MEVLYPPDNLDPRITVIGSANGAAPLLHELKQITSNITAIVNTFNEISPGDPVHKQYPNSTPSGDAVKIVRALSEKRFKGIGTIQKFLMDQSAANLHLADLEEKHGSFAAAITHLGDSMDICGSIVPITRKRHSLRLELDGNTIQGSADIDKHVVPSAIGRTMGFDTATYLYADARKTIAESDVIILAEGRPLTELFASVSISGVNKAIRASKAHVTLVTNVANHPKHTNGWHVMNHVKLMETKLGEDTIDTVFYNSDILLDSKRDPVRTDIDEFIGCSANTVGIPMLTQSRKMTYAMIAQSVMRIGLKRQASSAKSLAA